MNCCYPTPLILAVHYTMKKSKYICTILCNGKDTPSVDYTTAVIYTACRIIFGAIDYLCIAAEVVLLVQREDSS